MSDDELKRALQELRHRIINCQLTLDDVSAVTAMFKREKITKLSNELTSISQSLVEVEDVFDENVTIPEHISEVTRRAAQLNILFNLRLTTNEALKGAKSTLEQLRTDINFYRSLAISLFALLCSIVSIFSSI